MKKKILSLLMMIVIIYIILFLGLKSYYLIKYDYKGEVNNSILDAKFNEELTIKTKEVTNYIELDNLKIEDIFNEYQCTKKENQITCNNDDKKFKLEHQISYREMFYKALLNYDKEDFYIKQFHKSYKEILDKKFKTDYDFILFILNRNLESNFMTSIEDMRINYYINSTALNILPEAKKITKIKGSINGFVLSSNQNIIVVIQDEMKNYILTFTNNYDDEILNTIKIEK